MLVTVALTAGVPALGLPLVGSGDWTSAGLAAIAAGALIALAWLAMTATPSGRSGWKSHPVGTCPDCGYSNEGLGTATCPECGGVLPPSDRHVRALLSVHAATGPSECVVCRRPFSQDDPPGPCPSCGSRRRRPRGAGDPRPGAGGGR